MIPSTVTIKERSPPLCVACSIRSSAFAESMNRQLQRAKRAALHSRRSKSFIAVACLRLSRLNHLPTHPFSAAAHVG